MIHIKIHLQVTEALIFRKSRVLLIYHTCSVEADFPWNKLKQPVCKYAPPSPVGKFWKMVKLVNTITLYSFTNLLYAFGLRRRHVCEGSLSSLTLCLLYFFSCSWLPLMMRWMWLRLIILLTLVMSCDMPPANNIDIVVLQVDFYEALQFHPWSVSAAWPIPSRCRIHTPLGAALAPHSKCS